MLWRQARIFQPHFIVEVILSEFALVSENNFSIEFCTESPTWIVFISNSVKLWCHGKRPNKNSPNCSTLGLSGSAKPLDRPAKCLRHFVSLIISHSTKIIVLETYSCRLLNYRYNKTHTRFFCPDILKHFFLPVDFCYRQHKSSETPVGQTFFTAGSIFFKSCPLPLFKLLFSPLWLIYK